MDWDRVHCSLKERIQRQLDLWGFVTKTHIKPYLSPIASLSIEGDALRTSPPGTLSAKKSMCSGSLFNSLTRQELLAQVTKLCWGFTTMYDGESQRASTVARNAFPCLPNQCCRLHSGCSDHLHFSWPSPAPSPLSFSLHHIVCFTRKTNTTPEVLSYFSLLFCLKYLDYHATLVLFLFWKKYPSSLPRLTPPSILFLMVKWLSFYFHLSEKCPLFEPDIPSNLPHYLHYYIF